MSDEPKSGPEPIEDDAEQGDYESSQKILTGWSRVFMGRMLGRMEGNDPIYQTYKDLFDRILTQAVEWQALTLLLLDKKILEHRDLRRAITVETYAFIETLEQQFPGIKLRANGDVVLDPLKANETMKGWPS